MATLAFHLREHFSAVDETGNHDLTWLGESTKAKPPGRLTEGFAFPAPVSGYVQSVTAGKYEADDPFSIVLGLKRISQNATFYGYASRHDTVANRGWYVSTGGSSVRNRVQFVAVDTGSNLLAVQTDIDLPDNQPVLITITADVANKDVKFYFNRSPVAATVTSDTGTISSILTASAFQVNGRNGANNLYPSEDYEARLYDGILSQEELGDIYREIFSEPLLKYKSGQFLYSASGTHDWLGRAKLTELPSGVWVATYRSSTGHTSSLASEYHIRFSEDQGFTWTDEDTFTDALAVTGFPMTAQTVDAVLHEGGVVVAPTSGDLLFHAVEFGTNGTTRFGVNQWRSQDAGKTWALDGQVIPDLPANPNGLVWGSAGQEVTIGSVIYYFSWYDPDANVTLPIANAIWTSSDDGATWAQLTIVASTSVNAGEGGMCLLDDDTFLCVFKGAGNDITWMCEVTTAGVVGTRVNINPALSLPSHATEVLLVQPKLFNFDGEIYLVGTPWPDGSSRSLYIYKLIGDDWATDWSAPLEVAPYLSGDAGYLSLLKRTNGDLYGWGGWGTTTVAALYEYVIQDLSLKGSGTARSQADGDASITFDAVEGVVHELDWISYSYSDTPTSGALTVESPAGTVKLEQDITASGFGSCEFPTAIPGAAGESMVVTLAGGGTGIVGVLNAGVR